MPAPNCKDICTSEAMRRKRNELVTDPKDLFHKAYDQNPGGDLAGFGTWRGHIIRYEGLRAGLKRMLDQAVAKGCTIPQNGWEMLYKPAPLLPYK